jgi:hypothetical protein
MKATELDLQLAALKASVRDALPPPDTERAIAAAVVRAQRDATRASPRRDAPERWFAWPLALAATIAVLSFVVRSMPPDAVMADPVTARMQADASDFMPVVPLADIEGAGDAMVVSARLPRMTLAQLGLPINPARAADAIDTELLVRRDGSVLAVRFVY